MCGLRCCRLLVERMRVERECRGVKVVVWCREGCSLLVERLRKRSLFSWVKVFLFRKCSWLDFRCR